MIRLALAVGFLAVFGIVAYVLVLLLTNFFKPKERKSARRNFSKKSRGEAGQHPIEDKQ